MKIRLFYFILVVNSAFSQIFAIIGGIPASEYPFFVLIPKDNHICGGTILTPNIVITAAQCLYYETVHRWAYPPEVHVLYGNFSVPHEWWAKYYQAETYVVHEMYSSRLAGGTG